MRQLAQTLALALLFLAPLACKPTDSPPAAPAAPPAPPTFAEMMADAAHPQNVIIVLPDAGPDAVRVAEQAVREQIHNDKEVPPIRLDLVADLLSNNLLGIAPGDPAAFLTKKLGAAEEKRGDLWRWPSLGVEAVVTGDVVQRIALHALARPDDPKMKVFLGEVLIGTAALTQKAPDLQIKQVAQALGIESGRGQQDAAVTELSWKRGAQTLFVTFDNDKLTVEAIVLEPFDNKLWDAAKPLDQAKQIWDVEPGDVTAERSKHAIEFAQLPAELDNDLVRMRLIAGKQPQGKIFFDNVAAQLLGPTESLRKVKGQRVAMLRANGCTYVVIEKADNTWEARNPSAICSLDDEPKGVARIRKQFSNSK